MEIVRHISISTFRKTLSVMFFALVMPIAANSFFYLPFTPVPVTLQVLTVLLSAMILGFPLAFYSQLAYIGMGFMGLGVFAGFKNAYIAFAGPTAGYILGFAAASLVTGYLLQKKNRGPLFSLAAGLFCIYFFGSLHLMLYTGQAFFNTFRLGIAPFLIPDALKLMLAANIYKAIKGEGDEKNNYK